MYEVFYKLSSDPFRLLPDAGICFLHRSCARAWAYMRYALRRGEGIVVVTGPPGSGKTTLAERVMRDLNPPTTLGVRLVPDASDAIGLLRKLAGALGLQRAGRDQAVLLQVIEQHLVELGRTQRMALVVIDEAQALSAEALDTLRLLTDLQANGRPVLQLFLLGQTDLEAVLRAPEMEHFQQRVIAGCRLQPMDLDETKNYLEYRLATAGWFGDPSIDGPAVIDIYIYSRGIPRHVNKICSRLLLLGSAEDRHALHAGDVQTVVDDLRTELLAPLTASLDADIPEVDAAGLDGLTLVPQLAPPPAEPDRLDPLENLLLTDLALPEGTDAGPPQRPVSADRAGARSSANKLLTDLRRRVFGLAAAAWRLKTHNRVPVIVAAVLVVAALASVLVLQVPVGSPPRVAAAAPPAGPVEPQDQTTPLPGGTEMAVDVGVPVEQPDAAVLPASDALIVRIPVTAVGDPGALLSVAATPVDRAAKAIAAAGRAANETSYAAATSAVIDRLPQESTREEVSVARPGRDLVLATTLADDPTTPARQETGPVASTALEDAELASADSAAGNLGTEAPQPGHDAFETLPASAAGADFARLEVGGDAAGDDPAAGTLPADPAAGAQIARLLELADRALRQDRLLFPARSNANAYYRQVLALDAGNAQAADGLARIVRRYQALVESALAEGSFSDAERYLDRAARVRPDAAGDLGPWRERVAAARAESSARSRAEALAAAEAARLAKREAALPEPEFEPPPEPENNFRQLMRALD